MPQAFRKDPDSILDYTIDWEDWLDGDTISASTWEVDSSGIAVDSDTHTATLATVWLSGGTIGAAYDVTNEIVTATGRTEHRTITIAIGER